MDLDSRHILRDTAELEALYGQPRERSVRKQLDHLDEHCRAFIAASPLVILGTQGAGSNTMADNSPRGDAPGFVHVADDHTLLLPDRRGNNRVDTLHNILSNPRVGLLFLVPGVNEAFRVNGEAVISRDPELLERFAVQGKTPRTVLIVNVKEAYIHCSRALLRADLWNPAKHASAGAVPSFGTMMAAHTCGFVDAQTLDEENRVNVPATLY
jgi:PPOX class probable FMN-dependent enzyme